MFFFRANIDFWFRREWEPGIRVRRKLNNNVSKEGSNNGGASDIQSSSLLIRSRSNSQSGKKEPKSGGEGNGSVIQDSGFSTETSSSKETHSAFSTTGSAGVQVNIVNESQIYLISTCKSHKYRALTIQQHDSALTPQMIMNCGTYLMWYTDERRD